MAKSRCEMTSFIDKDNFLLPAQKMHCIKLFINNVAYTDCLWGFVGELTDPNDPNAMDTQLDGIRSYYSTLLDTSIWVLLYCICQYFVVISPCCSLNISVSDTQKEY